MFNTNEFITYIESEFVITGAFSRLVINCIELCESHFKDDFVNKLYELLDNTIGLEYEEIEKFYQEV